MYLSLNNTTYQDTILDLIHILDYRMSSEDNQTFLKDVTDSSHYMLNPITIIQSGEYLYNDSFGLIFRISNSLFATWDSSKLGTISVNYPDTIEIIDRDLNDTRKDLTLHFDNFDADSFFFSGLFFDRNEILPSEGRIKVVYDGNSNNYVLADN